MNQHTLTSSAESADSPSPPSGQDSEPLPSVRSTNTARKSSPKTLVRFFPTPNPRDHHAQGANHNPKAHSSSLATVIQKKGGRGDLLQCVCGNSNPHFAATSGTSTDDNFRAATSSQADFLASLSALPGSDEARQMTVRSGRRCSALLAKLDPLGCLAKTFLESSRWNSTTCFLTWKESATPRGRLLFRLVPSMPDTDETDCGLSEETWPSPKARDWKDGCSEACQEWSDLGKQVGQSALTGSLNPMWVEWLMGYPIGWTDLKDSGTQSCRRSRTKSCGKSAN